MKGLAAVALLLSPALALAHSASDAYLTLTTAPSAGLLPGSRVIQGEWDVALRDLDFALKLDDDGDGRLTWGEVRRHLPAIEHYAYGHLRISDDHGRVCDLRPTGRMIDAHADGAYAVLLFDVLCSRAADLTLDYDLFFAIDPSHRGIVVMHGLMNESTALLSPRNARIRLTP